MKAGNKLIPDEWLVSLRRWAHDKQAVRELWLFGSRAKGTDRPDSDVDLAVILMPPKGKHNWAYGDYVAKHSQWKVELEKIVGRHVSLEAVERDGDGWKEVQTGCILWKRG